MKTTKSQGTSYTERRFSVSDDANTLSGKLRGWNARRIQKAKSESEGINMSTVGIEEKEISVPSIDQGKLTLSLVNCEVNLKFVYFTCRNGGRI